jgi:hypothetical protein
VQRSAQHIYFDHLSKAGDMPQVTGLNGYLKAATDDAVYGRWLGWGARIRTWGHGIKIRGLKNRSLLNPHSVVGCGSWI